MYRDFSVARRGRGYYFIRWGRYFLLVEFVVCLIKLVSRTKFLLVRNLSEKVIFSGVEFVVGDCYNWERWRGRMVWDGRFSDLGLAVEKKVEIEIYDIFM